MKSLIQRAEMGRVGSDAIKQMNRLQGRYNKLSREYVELSKKATDFSNCSDYKTGSRRRRANFGVLGIRNKLKIAMKEEKYSC